MSVPQKLHIKKEPSGYDLYLKKLYSKIRKSQGQAPLHLFFMETIALQNKIYRGY